VEKYGDDVFMRIKDKKEANCNQWIDITWNQTVKAVCHMGAGLIEEGIKKNDCIAIFANNSPYWIITDQAIQGAGGIGVPIYTTSTDKQLTFILKDCGSKGIVAVDKKIIE
jgi:long-chain acyl-CoA synthetase